MCICQQFHLWSEQIREFIVRKTTNLIEKAEWMRERERVSEWKKNDKIHAYIYLQIRLNLQVIDKDDIALIKISTSYSMHNTQI